MTIRYLDSSAWVKRYVQEAGTAWVNELFESDEPLACATLGFVEVCAVLARKARPESYLPMRLRRTREKSSKTGAISSRLSSRPSW